MKGTTDIYAKYEILNQIGRGSYASVHKAINRHTGELCAIKRIPTGSSDFSNLCTEIGIISNCKFKNIVRYLASGCHDREILIVMEYCCGGSVKDVMRQLGRAMTEDQIAVILRDVLSGLEYLHSKDKIHRDVKAANILLNEKGIAKLGDFGVSEPVDSSSEKRTIIGTLLWLPPEVINQESNFSTAIDIWSLGITVIEMGDEQPPFSELEQSLAIAEIANNEKPSPTFKDKSKWSERCLDFVSLCLNKNASIRKKAGELLEHDLIKNAPSNDIIKDLVSEVCSGDNIKNLEQESSLYRMSECLLKESLILFGIYNERRMKVIKVDQMTGSLRNVEADFKNLRGRIKTPSERLQDTRKQLITTAEEIQKLEKEQSDLSTVLANVKGRRLQLEKDLRTVKAKLDDELVRRTKLRALESNNS